MNGMYCFVIWNGKYFRTTVQPCLLKRNDFEYRHLLVSGTYQQLIGLAFLGAVLTKFLQDLRKKMVDARDEKFEWRLKI